MTINIEIGRDRTQIYNHTRNHIPWNQLRHYKIFKIQKGVKRFENYEKESSPLSNISWDQTVKPNKLYFRIEKVKILKQTHPKICYKQLNNNSFQTSLNKSKKAKEINEYFKYLTERMSDKVDFQLSNNKSRVNNRSLSNIRVSDELKLSLIFKLMGDNNSQHEPIYYPKCIRK